MSPGEREPEHLFLAETICSLPQHPPSPLLGNILFLPLEGFGTRLPSPPLNSISGVIVNVFEGDLSFQPGCPGTNG